MKMVYAVSLGAQKELIDKLCFDKCGKICVGGLDIMGGAFLPCDEKKCKYKEKELKLKGKLEDGDEIIVRKLKSM